MFLLTTFLATSLWNISVTISKDPQPILSTYGLTQIKHLASVLLMIHMSLVNSHTSMLINNSMGETLVSDNFN